jgi:hypothetical protein
LVCGQNRWSISQDIFPNLLDKTLN